MSLDAFKNELETWDAALKAYDSNLFHKSLDLFSRIADTAKLVTNMALVYATIGEHETAVEQLTKAIDLDRDLTVAYFQRGVSNYLLKRYNSALKDFDVALVQLNGNIHIDYEHTDPKSQLSAAEVLFNKGLSLIELGREDDGISVFVDASRCPSDAYNAIEDAIKTRGKGCVLYSIPAGVLYRPSESFTKFLRQDDSIDQDLSPPLPTVCESSLLTPSNSSVWSLQQPNISGSSRKSINSLKSDASSTYAPSVRSNTMTRKASVSSVYKSFAPPAPDIAPNSCLSMKPTRFELNKVLGEDIITSTTEITTIPCAGLRISHGRLAGLMAWRFFVQLDEPSPKFRNCPRPGIITNFILDTGSGHSPVPPETLKALGYAGSLSPGKEIILNVQGVRTKCVVAYPEEAGRLCGQFMTAGSLTLYFDAKLDAPVLYVADEDLDRPKLDNIPRTVKPSSTWPMFMQRMIFAWFVGQLIYGWISE